MVRFEEHYNPRHTYRVEYCTKCGKEILRKQLQ